MRQGIPGIRRAGVAVLAAVTATLGLGILPFAQSAHANASFSFTRLGGVNRDDTARVIATSAVFTGATNAIVGRDDLFPDDLAANYNAGDAGKTPIVITPPSNLSSEASAALAGIKTATIVGGVNAVSSNTESQVQAKGITTKRIGGVDRYETAAKIASSGTKAIGTVGGAKTALVASGENFPDALAGGPAAYGKQLPLLLTNAASLNGFARLALTALGIKHVEILGGVNAVSAGVEASIAAMGISTHRLAGANRQSTAVAIDEFETGTLGFSTAKIDLARGDLFPDSLTGGAYAGQEDSAPILLTTSSSVLSGETCAELTKEASTLTSGHIFGGNLAVSLAVKTQALTCAGKSAAGGANVTSRPELQSAAIVSSNGSDGTFVKYCFDEPVVVLGASPGGFTLYRGAGVPGYTGNGVVNTDTNANCLNVQFTPAMTTGGPALTSSSATGQLTVATVALNVVKGNGTPPDTNPEGDAPLGSGSSSALQAGVTSAPDLTGESGFTVSPVNSLHSRVVFAFDQTAYHTTSGSLRLIRTNGVGADDVACTYVSGDGTSSITADCPLYPTGGATRPTLANTARGIALQLAVSAAAGDAAGPCATGPCNPLEAGTNPSAGPDLSSATLQLNVASSAGCAVSSKADRILFTFDLTVVLPPGAPGNFMAYTSGAATVTTACTAVRNAGNTTQVAVDFPPGALAQAVGASVLDGAVTGFSSGLANQEDEVGMANTGTTAVTPGLTSGPDLTSVTVLAHRDAFGAVDNYSGVYGFDERLVDGTTVGNLHLWDADGTQLNCDTLAPGDIDTTTPGTTDKFAVCVHYAGEPAGVSTKVRDAVLGTVDASAVVAQDGGPSNPEGALVTTKAG